MTETKETLKACPFCPGDEVVIEPILSDPYKEYQAVTCPDCDAWGPSMPTPEEAIVAWNTRPTFATLQAEVDSLTKTLEDNNALNRIVDAVEDCGDHCTEKNLCDANQEFAAENTALKAKVDALVEALGKSKRWMNAQRRTSTGIYYCGHCDYTKGHADNCQFIKDYDFVTAAIKAGG